MGSISGSPTFPDITGLSQQDITNELNTTQSAYQSAKTAFDQTNILAQTSAKTLLSARTTLQADQETLAQLLADPNATAAQIAAAQQTVTQDKAAYNQDFSAFQAVEANFNNAAASLVSATNTLFQQTVPYVTALALQQMYNAQDSDQTIAALVTQLSTLVGTPDANTPSWMLSAVVAATPNASDAERQAIIDAFNQYRLLEYNIAATRTDFISHYMAHLQSYYAWVGTSGGTGTYDFQSDTDWTAACNDQSQINAYISQRPTVLANLNAAMTNLGEPLLSALQYLQSGADLTAHLMESFTADYINQQNADNQALAAYEQLYPTENETYVEQATAPGIAQLKANQAALSSSQTVDMPALSPPSSNISMSDLMRIISKVQLMIQQLSRYVRQMDNQLGTLWTSSLLMEYEIEQARASAYNQWIGIVQQADAAYNATVDADNTTTLQSTLPALLSSLQFLVDPSNSTAIQNVITDANSQISTWNSYISGGATSAFITACNSIASDTIDNINSARSTYPEAPTYLDFFNFDSTVTAPPSLQAPSLFQGDLSTYQLPTATLDTTNINTLISSLQSLQSSLASGSLTPDQINSAINTMNSTLQSIVTDLSPALDVIQSQVPGGQQVSFSEIYLKQEVPPRVFQPYEPQFFLQFIQNLLNQIKQANINERDRADLNKVLAGLLMVIRTRSTDLQRQEVTKPGVSLGLEAASIEQYVSNIGPTISKLAQSEILATSLYGTLQSASMIAGLAAAGQNIKGLTSVMGISVAELFDELGINLNTFLEQQSTQALALAYSEQLALVAAQTTSLKQTAVNILSQIPGATSLTPDQVKELLATLLQFLQFLLMFMSMLMAALAGLGGAQFLTRIVGTIGGPPQQLLSALQTLGLPQEKAVALGVALGGKATDLQQILASMGLDPNASTLILALIGAQIGKVSLTQGVIGGPAFLDALLKKLSSYGITLTAQIGTDQFKKQLLDALQTKATSDQFSMLTDEINRMEQDVAGTKGEELSVEEITNELIDKVVADLAAASRAAAEQAAIAPAPVTPAITPAPPIVVPFAAPPAPPVTPPVTPPAPVAPIAITVAAAPIAPVTAAAPLPAPPAILPSDILAQYVTEFQKLPATAQAGLITLAKTQLTTIQGLTDEQKAALLIATRLGKTSVTEATTLAQLASMQTAGLVQYNDTITQAISRLFQESPEAKLAREDALKRAIVNEETRTKELLPNALPQRITDNISTSFKQVINNFDDKNLSLKIVDNFSKYVEKLSSFSKVGEMLLDPGKILLRLFSVLLTTSQDRIKRPPTLFGG